MAQRNFQQVEKDQAARRARGAYEASPDAYGSSKDGKTLSSPDAYEGPGGAAHDFSKFSDAFKKQDQATPANDVSVPDLSQFTPGAGLDSLSKSLLEPQGTNHAGDVADGLNKAGSSNSASSDLEDAAGSLKEAAENLKGITANV